MEAQPHVAFRGRILIVGFGSIGQAVLPLLLRHVVADAAQLRILTPQTSGADIAAAHGVPIVRQALTPENHRGVLEPLLSAGDLLLNLSVGVASLDLLVFCQAHGVLYLDTATEPWPGRCADPALPLAARTNYALREAVLALRRPGPQPAALITHGANPGLVSHFLKQALLDVAAASDGRSCPVPATRAEWARLAQRLGVRAIHVSERDTQWSRAPKEAGEFVNTWSVEGFVEEGLQPAELGWGTHERRLPEDGRGHETGSRAAIYLTRPGATTQVRSWTPLGGPMHGYLVTHAEAISIADLLTVGDAARPAYRPTVHYAYRPCDLALLSLHELAERGWRLQPRMRIARDELEGGIDELGVLLLGARGRGYWYGSQLDLATARSLCPHNSATTLQVAATAMAGVVWMVRHPLAGIVEPDDLPFEDVLALARPYLGEVVGAWTDWTPLAGRGVLFPESLAADDPWQFENVRVR
jgi:homospermidine synthase